MKTVTIRLRAPHHVRLLDITRALAPLGCWLEASPGKGARTRAPITSIRPRRPEPPEAA